MARLDFVDFVVGGSDVDADLTRTNEEGPYPAAVTALSCLGRDVGGGDAMASSSSSVMESTGCNGNRVARFGCSGWGLEIFSARSPFTFLVGVFCLPVGVDFPLFDTCREMSISCQDH